MSKYAECVPNLFHWGPVSELKEPCTTAIVVIAMHACGVVLWNDRGQRVGENRTRKSRYNSKGETM
jgi:hypothetical protein